MRTHSCDRDRAEDAAEALGMKTFEHWVETATEQQIAQSIAMCGSPRACYEFMRDALLRSADVQ